MIRSQRVFLTLFLCFAQGVSNCFAQDFYRKNFASFGRSYYDRTKKVLLCDWMLFIDESKGRRTDEHLLSEEEAFGATRRLNDFLQFCFFGCKGSMYERLLSCGFSPLERAPSFVADRYVNRQGYDNKKLASVMFEALQLKAKNTGDGIADRCIDFDILICIDDCRQACGATCWVPPYRANMLQSLADRCKNIFSYNYNQIALMLFLANITLASASINLSNQMECSTQAEVESKCSELIEWADSFDNEGFCEVEDFSYSDNFCSVNYDLCKRIYQLAIQEMCPSVSMDCIFQGLKLLAECGW